MGRMIVTRLAVSLLTVSPVLLGTLPALAQSSKPDAAARRPRPEQRPVLEVQQVSPELDELLAQWERASGAIRKLEGKHQRITYNTVFLTAKCADGMFYYEAPDKGRIDIKVPEAELPPVFKRVNAANGKLAVFKVQPDHPEIWVCDGQQIMQLNEETKKAEKFLIPEQNQGANIMDGPLPFLFGMPAEKAKKRYYLNLVKNTESQSWLGVKPRWPQDKSNYSQATIILDKKAFLPIAVQLIDPAGTTETVFTFRDLVPNRDKPFYKIFATNPFKPSLRGYQVHVNRTKTNVAATPTTPTTRLPETKPEKRVPSVMHFPWREAEAMLKKAGYVAEFERGTAAARQELIYVVYEQKPKPGTPLEKDNPVVLTLYTDASQSTN
jgi:TIGR03009 family protein